jgi:Glycosyl transferase family 90
MLVTKIRFRRIGIVTIISLLAQIALIVSLIWAVILVTNSDEHLPELLRKLRPAGNCLCESSTVFDCSWTQNLQTINNAFGTGPKDIVEDEWQFQHGRDDLDLSMSEDKCNVAFPGLFEEVHRAVGWRIEQGRNVTLADLDAVTIERGRIRAMIVDGKIRVLAASHSFDDHRKRALATLYSIYRAISADTKAIPNIEFIISLDDMVDTPSQHVWALTRRSQDQNLWLVPDFGFWSWDLEDVGTIDDVAEQIIREESVTGWDAKIQKLVWRGTPKMLPKLRGALLDASRGKIWGDVAALAPGTPPKNYLGAAEQCRYMFLAHAEGVSLVRYPEC